MHIMFRLMDLASETKIMLATNEEMAASSGDFHSLLSQSAPGGQTCQSQLLKKTVVMTGLSSTKVAGSYSLTSKSTCQLPGGSLTQPAPILGPGQIKKVTNKLSKSNRKSVFNKRNATLEVL